MKSYWVLQSSGQWASLTPGQVGSSSRVFCHLYENKSQSIRGEKPTAFSEATKFQVIFERLGSILELLFDLIYVLNCMALLYMHPLISVTQFYHRTYATGCS